MKQENGKKSLRWLPLAIGLVVLLAAVGVVLAVVLGGSKPQTQEPVQEDAILYWNVDRDTYIENSETGLSTREPGEDGLYHLRMVSEGQLLDLVTPDKKLVNIIDTMPVCILQMDGTNIINVTDPLDMGYTMNKGVYIQKVDEKTIVANTSIAMNGMPVRAKISEQLQILDCREKESTLGQPVKAADLLVMDYVTVCFNAEGDATHVFLAGRTPRSSLYWRAEQFYSSSTKETTRTPNADGVYHIDFFCDGERVTLACKDKAVVTAIDKVARLTCHTCLVFDEEGYITGTKASNLGLKALTGCDGYTVTSVDGDTFTAAAMTGKNAGTEFTGTLSADCKIYDVSKTALAEDRQGKAVENLQVGDRVTVWTDTDNNPVLIYVTIRLTDNPVYMSMERKYTTVDGKVQTTRKPDKNGWYTIEMVKVGENTPRTLKTKDIDVINTIDVPTNRIAALALDGNVILRAYESECIYGYTPLGPRYVTGFVSNVYSAITYKTPDSVVNGVVGPGCKVYDFSGTGKLGAETTLKDGDLIFVHRNSAEEAQAIFITKRAMGEDHLYWNLGRQYDSTKKVTTRQKDAEGWYVFNVAHKGKQTTVKTKNTEIATAMDAMTPGAMGLVVKNGVVQYAFDPIQTAGAVRVAFYSTVTAIDKDGTVHAVTTTGIKSSFKPAAGCKYYNTSAAFYSHKGEYTDGIKVNDLITGYMDMYGEAKFVYIYGRDVEEMYYNTQRLYDTTTKETTREPNGDGWYVFQLVVDGKIKELKTKDKAVATAVDKQTGPFGLLTKGDVIYSVVGADRVKDVDKIVCTNWNVIKVNGTKVKLQYQIPGSKDYTGKTMDVQLHKWHRAFDVSPTAAVFGGQVKLQVGDRVQMYSAEDGKILYTYIASHNTRAAGETGYCEHCKTEVHWEPWTGAAFTNGGHYYLNGDIQKTEVLAIGDSKKEFEVVLDLNGKTWTTTGARAVSVGINESLFIMDSDKGGTIASTGATEPVKSSDYAGGVVNLYDRGKLTVYSGTLKHLGENSKLTKGGTVYMGSTTEFTMYGGIVTGGTVLGDGSVGGNIYSENGKLTILGGTITGGKATGAKSIGGNIYVNAGDVSLTGGTITGGYATHVSGNIYCKTAMTLGAVKITDGKSDNLAGNLYCVGALTMENTTVTGGTAVRGANVYSTGDLIMKNCTVTGGTADVGVDLMHNGEKATNTVTIDGGQINNATIDKAVTKVTVSGKLLVYRMDLSSGAKLTLGELDKDARIYVKATGVFTEPNDKAAEFKGCFGKAKDADENDSVKLEGNVLKMAHVRPDAPVCTHCGEAVEWQIWDGTNTTAGHYYLTADYTATGSSKIQTKDGMILDLNGKKFEVTKDRAFYIDGGYLVLMDSVGTGVVKGNNLLGVGRGSIANVIGGKLEIYGGTLIPYATIKGGTAFYVSTAADGVTRSSFTMYGGVIDCSGLTGITGDSSAINTKGSDILLAGGHIKAESSMSIGANVNMTVSGAPVIDMLDLTNGAKLTLGELTDGASITVNASGVFTNENANAADYAEYFHSADDEATIKVTDGKLTVVYGRANAPKCPHCNEDVEWLEWTGDAVAAGHYYLTDNVTTAVSLTITDKEGVILDLNGKTYDATKTRAFYINGGYLAVVDTVGIGVVKGNNLLSAGKGSIANVIGGKFELYGGTLVPYAAVKSGTAFYISNSADGKTRSQFAIHGGTIDCSGLTGVSGVNAALNIKGADFTMTGGAIKAEAAMYVGANVVSAISGGEILGKVQVTAQTDMTLSGAPVFTDLTLENGAKITLGELTDGASVAVEAEGEFTAASENAQSYVNKKYIKALNPMASILVKENVLSISTEICIHCGKSAGECGWKALTATSGTIAAGHYYLNGDLTLSGSLKIADKAEGVVIDLRGNSLECKTARCFDVTGKLAVVDTENGGQMKGQRTGATLNKGNIAIINGGEFTMYGGTAIPATAIPSGSAFYVANSGKLVLNSGTIDCSALPAVDDTVGAIYVNTGSTFEMNGGTIKGAKAKSGSGVFVNVGTVVMTDGMITGGVSSNMGGGIFTMGASNVQLLGGTITGNTAGVSGNDVIVGNGGTVTVAGKLTIGEIGGAALTLGELKEGASIGIYGEGIMSNPNANTKAYVEAGYFFATQADKVLTVENDAIKLETEVICPHCGKTEAACNWQELTATSGTLAAGHYYLSGAKTLTGEFTVGGDVVLDLRGQMLSFTNRCFKVSGGNLSIMDTAEGGQIKGAGTSWGGAIYVASGKALNLYGGTVTAGSNTTQGGVIHVAGAMTMTGGTVTGTGTSTTTLGGAIYVTGTFRMQGGTVNGASAKNGAAIYAKNAIVQLEGGTVNGGTAATGGGVAYLHQCTTTISGGTYGGGTAKSGGNFFVEAGTFNVSGGTFNGGTVTNTAANIYILRYSDNSIPCNATITGGVFTCGTVGGNTTNKSGVEVGYTCTLALSGDPQIQALFLNTGVKMDVGTMTENAKVYVASVDAVISKANTNMQSYVDSKFFEALEATKKLVVTDGIASLKKLEENT